MSNQFLAENVQRIHDLHERGISASEISKIIGCSIKTVKRWISYGEYELKDDARIILRENWRAHCDTCIYAFRKPVESHSIYSSAACELEVENKKNCRRWLDTKPNVPIPEWISAEEDLPQLLKDHKSIIVYMRLRNGEKVEGFYNDNTCRWYYKNGKRISDKDPVVKWRSKDE